jgi:predicted thioredoxin/glutaredoxin
LTTLDGDRGPAAQTRLTVVHRQDCDLCDEMVTELEALGRTIRLPPIDVVDVDSDPQLVRRYGLNVPVLLLDGTVVCRHRLDADELQRLLR